MKNINVTTKIAAEIKMKYIIVTTEIAAEKGVCFLGSIVDDRINLSLYLLM